MSAKRRDSTVHLLVELHWGRPQLCVKVDAHVRAAFRSWLPLDQRNDLVSWRGKRWRSGYGSENAGEDGEDV